MRRVKVPAAHPDFPGPDDTPRVSVVIATYNQPEALKRVLPGYERQTFRSFEVLLADDGSSPENLEAARALLAA